MMVLRSPRWFGIVTTDLVSLAGCGGRATATTTDPLAADGGSDSDASAGDNPKCVWDESFQREALDAGLEMVGGPEHIKLGDNFQSVNACNACGCTERGLECTHNACPHTDTDDYNCASDTSQCPDGPLMRRFGPNCLFPTCLAAMGHSCLAWALSCDGGAVARQGPFCTMTCP